MLINQRIEHQHRICRSVRFVNTSSDERRKIYSRTREYMSHPVAKLIKLIDDAFLIWESKENLKGYPNVTNLTEESPPTKLNSSILHENAHLCD